jgi:hypothetical protein
MSPAFGWQVRIREQNLAYTIRVFHRDGLAFPGSTCVVVKFGESQDVARYLHEIGISVLDRDR